MNANSIVYLPTNVLCLLMFIYYILSTILPPAEKETAGSQ